VGGGWVDLAVDAKRLGATYHLPQTCAKSANMKGLKDKVEIGDCAKK
jgi:hypothetical protein